MLIIQNSKYDVSLINEKGLLVLYCNFSVCLVLFFIITLGEQLFVRGVIGLASTYNIYLKIQMASIFPSTNDRDFYPKFGYFGTFFLYI